MKYDVKNINLAKEGVLRIEWAKEYMPVLSLVEKRFRKERPFKGLRISCCLHVTTETAVLAAALKAGGAKVILCASNPLSTQDDVAASLVKHEGIGVFAKKGEDRKTYYAHINKALTELPLCIRLIASPNNGAVGSTVIFLIFLFFVNGIVSVTTNSSITEFLSLSIAGPQSTA